MELIVTLMVGLIVAFAFVLLITMFALLIAVFGKKETRTMRLKKAAVLPGVAVFSFLCCMFVGNVIITTITGTDMGIGDNYYVPLKKGYSLHMPNYSVTGEIDSKTEKNIITDISLITAEGTMVYGRRTNDLPDRGFSLDMQTGVIKDIPTDDCQLVEVEDFYFSQYRKATSVWFIIAAIISIFVSYKMVRMGGKSITKGSAPLAESN